MFRYNNSAMHNIMTTLSNQLCNYNSFSRLGVVEVVKVQRNACYFESLGDHAHAPA